MDAETPPAPDLDPADWEAFSLEAHRALDLMLDHLRGLRTQQVWRQAPADVQARFQAPLPRQGQDFGTLIDTFATSILPYGSGNTHPLFMGWVQGAGTPVGMVAEMLAAGLNANCGGRNHIALDVERQITLWLAEIFGFPQDASGVFVTGTSMANLVAALVARADALGEKIRSQGLCATGRQLTGYASQEAHGCVDKAFDLAGIGAAFLRRLPVDAEGAIRIEALRDAIARDRAEGFMPAMVIGTAGTVNTGAFDAFDVLADLCADEDLWFHIDGAFGALCALSPTLRHLVKGMERADSIALDFHKWLHVPYDAGFFLCRDPQAHQRAFGSSGAYLARAPRGLAAGEIWPCDLGPDLSRSFRALKTWFTFQAFGAEKLGATIAATCTIAKHLADLIEASPDFELRAPVKLNIVCFGARGFDTDTLNRAIVMDLHEQGIAAPSLTILDGRPVIRAAILNHRTRASDMDVFIAAAAESAARLRGAR
ncbi:L-2,4-diaminobutyrate decarboxylase [Methylovirgula sp. HY1]|nr:pyridoxal-dependent decarboxylase [Methylovirgula sp. HY1]QXX76207.1 L-2,4-diaminobutyrate decarboxylase [Methylovirgula sp. HY1]